ncbi:hypothetical protein AAVH_30242 [Aphelenchoides avenae]|nr:hypothetical protein AAVH_30242 [Aphelenchus avenae]
MPEEKEKLPPHEELKKGLELLGPAAENMSEEQIRTLLSDFKKRRDDLAENMKKQQVEVVRGTRISKWDVTTTPATEVEVERNDIDCMGFSDEDTDPVKLQYDSYKEHSWFVVRTSRPFLALVVIDVSDQPAARIVVSGYGSERFEPRTDTVKVTVSALPFPSFFALESHLKRMVELFPIVERNKIPGEVKELRFRCDEHDAKGVELFTQLEQCEGKLTNCEGKLAQLVQEIGCDRVNHVKLVDDFRESSRVQGALTEESLFATMGGP